MSLAGWVLLCGAAALVLMVTFSSHFCRALSHGLWWLSAYAMARAVQIEAGANGWDRFMGHATELWQQQAAAQPEPQPAAESESESGREPTPVARLREFRVSS